MTAVVSVVMVVCSCQMDLNFEFLKYKIWEYLGLIVVYTKKRGG